MNIKQQSWLKDLPDVISPGQFAEASGISLSTIAYWRHKGTGPRFMKINRMVRYRKCDLIEFFNSKLCTSNAEADSL